MTCGALGWDWSYNWNECLLNSNGQNFPSMKHSQLQGPEGSWTIQGNGELMEVGEWMNPKELMSNEWL